MKMNDAIKALDGLHELARDDAEVAHSKADAILLEYVPPAVKAAYERVVEQADWWATA